MCLRIITHILLIADTSEAEKNVLACGKSPEMAVKDKDTEFRLPDAKHPLTPNHSSNYVTTYTIYLKIYGHHIR